MPMHRRPSTLSNTSHLRSTSFSMQQYRCLKCEPSMTLFSELHLDLRCPVCGAFWARYCWENLWCRDGLPARGPLALACGLHAWSAGCHMSRIPCPSCLWQMRLQTLPAPACLWPSIALGRDTSSLLPVAKRGLEGWVYHQLRAAAGAGAAAGSAGEQHCSRRRALHRGAALRRRAQLGLGPVWEPGRWHAPGPLAAHPGPPPAFVPPPPPLPRVSSLLGSPRNSPGVAHSWGVAPPSSCSGCKVSLSQPPPPNGSPLCMSGVPKRGGMGGVAGSPCGQRFGRGGALSGGHGGRGRLCVGLGPLRLPGRRRAGGSLGPRQGPSL